MSFGPQNGHSMKVASITLHEFKRFKDIHVDVRNSLTGDVADRFLILGDNGTGKTTLLQAVALCLARAATMISQVEDFDWIGWVPGRYSRWGNPHIELEVHFTPDEIQATQEAAERWYHSRAGAGDNTGFKNPGDSAIVTLRLEGNQISTGRPNEIYQFQGRRYAATLLKTDPTARNLFERLPGIFWFDQFRNLASPPASEERSGEQGRVAYQVGVSRLRQSLNTWQLAKISGTQYKRDYLVELETLYAKIFAGRSFGAPEPMYSGAPSPSDYYFILKDGNRTYDLEEMSAGEQSVFPILYEFVRLQIRNSVVIIDEVDLNLHPPLAQSLISSLPAMGAGCQFLLTTHAQAVSSVMSPEQIYRLAGGRLCL